MDFTNTPSNHNLSLFSYDPLKQIYLSVCCMGISHFFMHFHMAVRLRPTLRLTSALFQSHSSNSFSRNSFDSFFRFFGRVENVDTPCRTQCTIIAELKKTYDGQKAMFLALNLDNSAEIALNLGIQSIPSIIILKSGKEIRRFVGLQQEGTVREAIDRALHLRGEQKF